VQVWPGHGAGSACGKALGSIPQSTVGYERRFNVGLSFDTEDGFVASILDGQPEPPIYFARMKDLNKNGVPVLGDLPAPKAYSIDELAERGAAASAVVVDREPVGGSNPGTMASALQTAMNRNSVPMNGRKRSGSRCATWPICSRTVSTTTSRRFCQREISAVSDSRAVTSRAATTNNAITTQVKTTVALRCSGPHSASTIASGVMRISPSR